MNYEQTVAYLYTRLPMFSATGGAAIKPGLKNITALCEYLGNPQTKFKSIHVAGTNGKGSVCHMLSAILQTAGYKTGLHTSPHLYDFRERMKINGAPAPEAFVVDFVQQIKPVIEQLNPSFFEISVAMAFEYFARQQVDIAVIETGMGGRLDSTNIIMPIISIITNIGNDHQQFLGNTPEAIAKEKAGIIKYQTPVVIGEATPATKKVFETTANEQQAPIYFATEQLSVADFHQDHALHAEVTRHNHTDHYKYQLDLPGIYQLKNLLPVLQATHMLQQMDWHIKEADISNGLKQVVKLAGLHGRWEIIQQKPLVVLDVAHNEDGIQQVLQQVELIAPTQLHCVLGMVKDKDINAVLNLLPAQAHYYFTEAKIPRALPKEMLQKQAAAKQLSGNIFNNVNEAIGEALLHAGENDLVLVCGSVFLVAEVIRK